MSVDIHIAYWLLLKKLGMASGVKIPANDIELAFIWKGMNLSFLSSLGLTTLWLWLVTSLREGQPWIQTQLNVGLKSLPCKNLLDIQITTAMLSVVKLWPYTPQWSLQNLDTWSG